MDKITSGGPNNLMAYACLLPQAYDSCNERLRVKIFLKILVLNRKRWQLLVRLAIFLLKFATIAPTTRRAIFGPWLGVLKLSYRCKSPFTFFTYIGLISSFLTLQRVYFIRALHPEARVRSTLSSSQGFKMNEPELGRPTKIISLFWLIW